MEFTFSKNRWILEEEPLGVESDFALGMHIPRRWDKILDIDSCDIMPSVGSKIVNFVRDPVSYTHLTLPTKRIV